MNGAGVVLASQTTGWLIGRYSETRLLAAGLLVGAAGGAGLLVAALAGSGLYGLMPFLFLIVSCIGMIGPTSNSLALQRHGRTAGIAAALLGVLSLLLSSLTSTLVGMGGGISMLQMSAFIAASFAGAIVCFLYSTRSGRLQGGE